MPPRKRFRAPRQPRQRSEYIEVQNWDEYDIDDDKTPLSEWTRFREDSNFIANLTEAMGSPEIIKELTGYPRWMDKVKKQAPTTWSKEAKREFNIRQDIQARAILQNPGVHFTPGRLERTAGHFYAKTTSGEVKDSYSMGLQPPQTSGFRS